jgi:hypothetical protein
MLIEFFQRCLCKYFNFNRMELITTIPQLIARYRRARDGEADRVPSSLETAAPGVAKKCVPRRSWDNTRASLIWRIGAAIWRKPATVDG